MISQKNNRQNQSAGFTLIELLIGIAISGLIFVAIGSLMLVLLTSNTRTKQLDELEQAKNDLLQNISNTVRWGGKINYIDMGDSDILEVGTAPTLVSFNLNNGVLERNGQPLNSTKIKITGFNIDDFSIPTSANLKSLQITLTMEYQNFTSVKDILRIVVSERISEISV